MLYLTLITMTYLVAFTVILRKKCSLWTVITDHIIPGTIYQSGLLQMLEDSLIQVYTE